MENKLYYGDNLKILREHIKEDSVDLIYLDPPFNSQANYNILFKEGGEESKSQIQAFTDFWKWNEESSTTYDYLTTHKDVPDKVKVLITALHDTLRENQMSAYLVMMTVRLLELKRVLKPTGLLYLHCDPTASHYIKLILDAIFGEKNFRNEIIWCYAGGGIPKMDFPNKHDIIFRYSKTDEYKYHPEFHPYSESTAAVGRHSTLSGGKALDLERGTPINDWWADLKKETSYTKDWMPYQTKKPQKLLERILQTSSDKGDIILDPFCGCGTTIYATEELGDRTWIGIDITHLAINLIKRRLKKKYPKSPFKVYGEPEDLKGAVNLSIASDNAKGDGRYQFQWWALALIGAAPREKKKGADKGIDGLIFYKPFNQPKGEKPIKVLVQVKSGGVERKDISVLSGDMDTEKADFGIFITLEDSTQPMRDVATAKGFYKNPINKDKQIPRIEIITIKELLEEEKIPKVQQVYENINMTYEAVENTEPVETKKKGKDRKL